MGSASKTLRQNLHSDCHAVGVKILAAVPVNVEFPKELLIRNEFRGFFQICDEEVGFAMPVFRRGLPK